MNFSQFMNFISIVIFIHSTLNDVIMAS